MRPKKYHIFVSSTYDDLKEERDAVMKAILRLEHIPIGMEMFNAGSARQWELIKRAIDDSDYYLLLIGFRYGSIFGANGISYTEREYNYALKKGVPILAFIQDRNAPVPSSVRESNPIKIGRLERFVDKISRRECAFWVDKNDLSYLVTAAISQEARDFPGTGWIHADYETVRHELAEYEKRSRTLPHGHPLYLDPSHANEITPIGFFSQERTPPEYTIPRLIDNAVRIHALVRAGVTLLSAYERNFSTLIRAGCEFKYLTVREEAPGMLYGHDDAVMYRENLGKVKQHLTRLAKIPGSRVELRTTDYAPTVSVIYIEKQTSEAFLLIQMYFVTSRIGRDRPMFVLSPENEWYDAFKDELDLLWGLSKPLDVLGKLPEEGHESE